MFETHQRGEGPPGVPVEPVGTVRLRWRRWLLKQSGVCHTPDIYDGRVQEWHAALYEGVAAAVRRAWQEVVWR